MKIRAAKSLRSSVEYSDSNYATNEDDTKSVSGNIVTQEGILFHVVDASRMGPL
jgi:hypothetical protein